MKSQNWEDLPEKKVNVKSHSFEIIQEDKNSVIDWKNPVIESHTFNTQVRIAEKPFSEGHFRYAFQGYDQRLNHNLVLKALKEIDLENYNIQAMSKDLTLVSICNLIVNQFNERMIDKVCRPNLLRDFVRPFIFEFMGKGPSQLSDQKFLYAENYIDGDYNKQSNNLGWKNESWSDEALIAQTLSHFSW